MRLLLAMMAVGMSCGCTMEHRANGWGRGPFFLRDSGEVREVYEVMVQWSKPLFRVYGGVYLFDRPDPSGATIANMERFGSAWRSPESERTCQWLIRDQSPQHEFFILSLNPDICIGESIERPQRNFRASIPFATLVPKELLTTRISRIIKCKWQKAPSDIVRHSRSVELPADREISQFTTPISIAEWLNSAVPQQFLERLK